MSCPNCGTHHDSPSDCPSLRNRDFNTRAARLAREAAQSAARNAPSGPPPKSGCLGVLVMLPVTVFVALLRWTGRHRVRVGRLQVYFEPRDVWVGVYVARDAVYVCPLPVLVFRWGRRNCCAGQEGIRY